MVRERLCGHGRGGEQATGEETAGRLKRRCMEGGVGWGGGDKGSPELSSRKLTIRKDKERLLFIELLLYALAVCYSDIWVPCRAVE